MFKKNAAENYIRNFYETYLGENSRPTFNVKYNHNDPRQTIKKHQIIFANRAYCLTEFHVM